MEKPKMKVGRRPIDPATKKRNRAISLTDVEYKRLNELAASANLAGPSAYIVRTLFLS